jgi:hypothetical protein
MGMIADMNLSAIYRFNEVWGLRVGYNLLWLTGVALAPDQFDFTRRARHRRHQSQWLRQHVPERCQSGPRGPLVGTSLSPRESGVGLHSGLRDGRRQQFDVEDERRVGPESWAGWPAAPYAKFAGMMNCVRSRRHFMVFRPSVQPSITLLERELVALPAQIAVEAGAVEQTSRRSSTVTLSECFVETGTGADHQLLVLESAARRGEAELSVGAAGRRREREAVCHCLFAQRSRRGDVQRSLPVQAGRPAARPAVV